MYPRKPLYIFMASFPITWEAFLHNLSLNWKNTDQTEIWTKIAKLLAMLRETMAAQLKTRWKDKFTKIIHVVASNALIK